MNDTFETNEKNETTLYQDLAAPFDDTFKDNRGGVDLEYITGEQAVSRLNDELGFLNWSFRIVEHGIHAEADECWALGEIAVTYGGKTIQRQQFGSQKVKRSRASGSPLDIGFDLKGAGTDALKKCASLVGVALYLWKKNPQANFTSSQGGSQGGYTPRPQNGSAASSDGGSEGGLTCDECGEDLTETKFKDGDIWTPEKLASFGQRKHNRTLCMNHYREANQSKRRAEEALQQVPF